MSFSNVGKCRPTIYGVISYSRLLCTLLSRRLFELVMLLSVSTCSAAWACRWSVDFAKRINPLLFSGGRFSKMYQLWVLSNEKVISHHTMVRKITFIISIRGKILREFNTEVSFSKVCKCRPTIYGVISYSRLLCTLLSRRLFELVMLLSVSTCSAA